MATNDPAESPFASLTHQMQTFGRVLGVHAAAIAHARQNGDFKRDLDENKNNGAFFGLSPEMHDSILRFTLSVAPAVRKAEKDALD